MRKLVGIAVLCVMVGVAAFGEEATVIPNKHLRLSQDFGLGAVDNDLLVNGFFGFGAEFATSDWLNLQFLWPGLNVMPDLNVSSMFLGAKGYFIGNGALISSTGTLEKFRISGALGILIPPGDEPDLLNQDQKLWGTVLRLYADYIINRYVYINLFYENVFYPPQYQNDNVEAYRDWVRHYRDFTWELEAHFEVPFASGITLKGGVPIKFFCAPYMNASDEYATSQYYFSMGTYIGIKFPGSHPPFELYMKYTAPLVGQNIRQAHRVGITSKVTIPPETWKIRGKSRAVSSEEGAGNSDE
jgi:hypothetical protein